ncbi:MAG TPA: AMP-binding protein, partial [Spirochaetia bacterium]|nr:AMP-binding protein [Spirochaetia bacterium]
MPEQPWLPYYGDIPATISYPDMTIYELLERSSDEYPDHTAIDFLGGRTSYRRLHRLVLAAARGLRAIGVRPGDRLALLMPNTPHAVVLFYAANRIGAVTSLYHAEAGSGDVASWIADLDPNWMAVNPEHLDGLMRLLAGRSIRGILLCRYDDFGRKRSLKLMHRMRRRNGIDLGGIRGVAARADASRGSTDESPPTFSWNSFIRLGDADDLPSHRDLHTPDDLALVLYTGGTTGEAVGVMHSDRQLTAVALQAQVQGPLLAGQSLLSVVPLSHGYGIAVAVHATVSAAATSIMIPHSTPRDLAKAIGRKQPEYLIGVPSTYAGLILDRVFRRTRHRTLMGAFCGGDRLPRSVRDGFEFIVRRRGGAVPVREGYGLTETVTACATMPDGERRPASVGIPYPDTFIGIARPISSFPLADEPPLWLEADEVGEILVSGPTVMTGYWGRDEASRRVLHVDDDGRAWLRTGDLGRMDDDGFLYFVER